MNVCQFKREEGGKTKREKGEKRKEKERTTEA